MLQICVIKLNDFIYWHVKNEEENLLKVNRFSKLKFATIQRYSEIIILNYIVQDSVHFTTWLDRVRLDCDAFLVPITYQIDSIIVSVSCKSHKNVYLAQWVVT